MMVKCQETNTARAGKGFGSLRFRAVAESPDSVFTRCDADHAREALDPVGADAWRRR